MSVRLQIDVFGDRAIDRRLLRFSDAALDLRPALDGMAELLNRSVDRQFATEGGYGSGGWAPLRPATAARKAAEGSDSRILHRTLRLRNSLASADHPEHVQRATADALDWGSIVPYGIHHQQGTGNMPARKPIQLPDADRREAVRVLQRHLVERTSA